MSLKPKPFPNLNPTNHTITSPETTDYNCIAWAAEDDTKWWWPTDYWPVGVPTQLNIDSFIKAYGTLGYVVCESSDFEDGYAKIMIYCKEDVPTHAARLIGEQTWTSKLGNQHDISHKQNSLNGPAYGTPHTFMKKIKTV